MSRFFVSRIRLSSILPAFLLWLLPSLFTPLLPNTFGSALAQECKQSSDCPKNEFCYWEMGICGSSVGRCEVIPEICTLIYLPVCSCSGKTFPSECAARAKGESVRHEGRCSERIEKK